MYICHKLFKILVNTFAAATPFFSSYPFLWGKGVTIPLSKGLKYKRGDCVWHQKNLLLQQGIKYQTEKGQSDICHTHQVFFYNCTILTHLFYFQVLKNHLLYFIIKIVVSFKAQ